jgi:hypothetical protein
MSFSTPSRDKSAATHSDWRRNEGVAASSTPQSVLPGVFDTGSFDLQRGFTIVGYSLRLTFSPGHTRKAFEWIVIVILSSLPAALFASVHLWD